MSIHSPNIVTIGGGTGSYTVLSGLKRHTDNIQAIVSMSDNGGSTGMLRNELEILPPGDVRQAIIALMADNDASDVLREFFNYRPARGPISGHPVGNVLLAALEDFTKSNARAVEALSDLLRITGRVIPVTTEPVNLNLRLPNGKIVEGEDRLGEECAGKDYFIKGTRPNLYLDPAAALAPAAQDAILDAELVVICPGKLYTSVGSNLLYTGMVEALTRTSAKVVYVCNLMTQVGQTDHFGVADSVAALENLAGTKFIDVVLYNTRRPTRDMLAKYAAEGETPISYHPHDFTGQTYQAVGLPLLSDEVFKPQAIDKLRRTLIRHDPDRIARALMSIYYTPSQAQP